MQANATALQQIVVGKLSKWVINCRAGHRPSAAARHLITDTNADGRRGRDGPQATSRWAFEKFWIIKLAATTLGGIGGASVTRPWIGAISPRHANLLPALVLLVGAGKGIWRRRKAVDLKVLELALLGTDLYWTI